MKKRFSVVFAVLLAFALGFALSACGGSTPDKIANGNFVAEGSFGEGVTLSASALQETDAGYKTAMDRIATEVYDDDKVAVCDISLVRDETKIQPDGKVKITMPAPFESEHGYITYHIGDNSVETLETTFADGKISFETTGFSYFVVAGALPPLNTLDNFFAYADTPAQGTLTAGGEKVKRNGYSTTLSEGEEIELVATVGDGYQITGWYKNSKDSGSRDRYDVRSNPGTFTYTGTEKMFVYARFEVETYTITVDLKGGALASGDSIPESYTIETDTIKLPVPVLGDTKFIGWKTSDGTFVTEIPKGSFGHITLIAKWEEPAYVRVDKDKNPTADGEYVLFGSYPQTKVTKIGTRDALTEMAGEKPQNGKNGKWTSFDYYYTERVDGNIVLSDEIDFMWYIDLEYNDEKYRGIYFTHFRPEYALNRNTGVLNREVTLTWQYKNHYFGDTVYWFRYEPILWKIIGENENSLKLLSMSVLDCQPYCTVAEMSEDKTYTNQEKGEGYYAFYNVTPGVPKGTVATDYTYSNIRNWLNDTFYSFAFDNEQKARVNDTTLDNVSVGLGSNTTDKVFLINYAEAVALGSDADAERNATDYSQSQGVGANPYYGGRCSWYLRELYYKGRFSPDAPADIYRFDGVCYVDYDGSRTLNFGKYTDPRSTYVAHATEGVVPAVCIAK